MIGQVLLARLPVCCKSHLSILAAPSRVLMYEIVAWSLLSYES